MNDFIPGEGSFSDKIGYSCFCVEGTPYLSILEHDSHNHVQLQKERGEGGVAGMLDFRNKCALEIPCRGYHYC